MNQNNSLGDIARYYIKDVKIAALLGFVTAILTFVALMMGGYTPHPVLWITLMFGFPFVTFFGLLAAIALQGMFPHAVQFAKFGIIGGLSTLINLAILNTLFFFTGITSGPLFSAFVAGTFFFGLLNGFFFNKHWAFKTRTNNKLHIEFGKFVLVAFGGLIINVITASFIVNVIGAPEGVPLTFWANTGAVVAVFVAMTWNFFGYKYFVFKED